MLNYGVLNAIVSCYVVDLCRVVCIVDAMLAYIYCAVYAMR